MKHNLAKPKYSEGFSISVTLGTVTTTGFGKSKREAKNEACGKMLELINKIEGTVV